MPDATHATNAATISPIPDTLIFDTPAPDTRRDWRVAALLVFFGLLILAQRWYTYHEPFERNIPNYAVIAHALRDGRALYSDVFDQKPPAIHLTYLAGELLFGYGRFQVFMLGLIAAWFTLAGVYAAGRTLFQDRRAGLIAAAVYAVIASDMNTQANQPNAEAFMLACSVWTFWLFTRNPNRLISIRAACGAGALIALCSLYKNVGVLIGLPLIAIYVVSPPAPANRRAAMIRAALSVGVVVLAWLAVCGYFAAKGRFGDFYYDLITYNQTYSGSLKSNLRAMLSPRNLVPRSQWFLLPYAAVIIAGFAVCRDKSARRMWLLFAAWSVGTALAVGLPGRFYYYYYQMWLPVVAVGSGWTVATLRQIPRPFAGRLALAAAVLVILLAVVREARPYRTSPDNWALYVLGPTFIQSNRVGDQINALITPGETFYDAAMNPELYFLSKRPLQSGVFYADPIRTGPRRLELRERLLRDLAQRPPDLIVRQIEYPPDPALFGWIEAHYERLSSLPDAPTYALYARRNSDFAARMSRQGRTAVGSASETSP